MSLLIANTEAEIISINSPSFCNAINQEKLNAFAEDGIINKTKNINAPTAPMLDDKNWKRIFPVTPPAIPEL